MSEVFAVSGEKSENIVTPTPQLQGLFIPGIDSSQAVDGFGVVIPWGGGSTARRYGDYGISTDISRQSTQLNDLASSFIPAEGAGITYNWEGLVGPQGIPGRDGIDGIIHIMGLNFPQNSNYLTALPHNLDLINGLGTAVNKLIYTSAYTPYRDFVWVNSPIAAVSFWNDSDINTDASFLIVAGDVGVYISTDDGDSWRTDTPDSDTFIQTSCAGASGEAVVLGNTERTAGTIWVTDDYGVNWSEKTVIGAGATQETFELSDGTGASIYGTTWGMTSWTTTSAFSITAVALYCYKYGSPGNITVSIREVDENGKPTGGDLCSVTVADSGISAFPTRAWYTFTFDTPYAGSDATQYAIVFRATSGSGSHYFGPFGYGSSGYADGGYASSSNSGGVWGTVSTTNDMDFRIYGAALINVRSIWLGSDGSFLVAGGETGVYLSTDLGDNWTRKTPDAVEDTDWVKGICSDDGTYIIVVSSANAIYRSANSGTAWAAITPAGGDTFSVNKLATSDDGQFMVIVGENTTDATESCYISTDYGATWTAKKPVAASIEWTECDISNDGAIIAVSTSTYFYISFDSGVTWIEQGMASSAEVWEGLSVSGDGITGLVANTNDNNEFFIGTNTLLYSEATWAESTLTSAGRAILDDANAAAQATTLGLGVGDSPIFVSATLTDLSASRLIWGDADKALASKDLVDLIGGTENRVMATDDAAGGVTINAPQDLHLDATPEWAGTVIKDSGDNVIFFVDDNEMYFTASVEIPIEAGMSMGLLLALTYASP